MDQYKYWISGIILTSLIACSQTQRNPEEQLRETTVQREFVAFVYHRFGDNRFPSTNISLSDFEAHLEYLKNNGFSILTFGDAIDYVKGNGEEKKVAVISIDDGYKSFIENGWPLLKEYQAPATVFINSETVGSSSYMDWTDIKQLLSEGIEIGNHTHSHDYFLNLDSNRYKSFKSNVMTCQQEIKLNTGYTPKVFAYPYGEYDNEMKGIIRELGFKAAAAQNSGVVHSGTDIFASPRFPMANNYTGIDKFMMKANMHPLMISGMDPQEFIVSPGQQPTLKLIINNESLIPSSLQCFIQGSDCDLKINSKDNGELELQLAPKNPLSGRRTLYTITAKDTLNEWHWFSRLWICPQYK